MTVPYYWVVKRVPKGTYYAGKGVWSYHANEALPYLALGAAKADARHLTALGYETVKVMRRRR